MLITSLENERIKEYMKLKNRKYREKTGTFLVEGSHLVLEALRAGLVIEVILEQDEIFPVDVPIIYVTNEIIMKLSEVEAPTKIMALCKKKEENLDLGRKVVVLDGVQDPGNLGTIVRSSKAFHVDTIVLGEGCVDLYNPKVIRSTQGMMFHMNIVRKKVSDVIEELRNQDIPIYGTRVEYGSDVRTLGQDNKNSYCLIMGNEGNGVRSEILDLCDKYLYIAMDDMVESLNVAVATSIILYELDRRD